MEYQSILTQINSVAEAFDIKIFQEVVYTIQEQIKCEKQKQEIKEIMEEAVTGLIKVSYDLEDEKTEQEFYRLLEDLAIGGFDIGKILIKEMYFVKNSEQQTKLINMIELILKASSWIRKISLSQKLDPVISHFLSQNTPIRIREMLQRMHTQIKPYLKKQEKESGRSITLTLHSDKTFLIEEWINNPKIYSNHEPHTIHGITMLDFFSREVNFEILLDYILFKDEIGVKVLHAISQILPYFKNFKKFNPEKTVADCVRAAMASNNTEFTAVQSIQLLKIIYNMENSSISKYFITRGSMGLFIKNLAYPDVRSFLFVHVIGNKNYSREFQNAVKSSLIIELYKKLTEILINNNDNEKIYVLEMLNLLLPELLEDSILPKADEFEISQPLNLKKYRTSILTMDGQMLIAALFSLILQDFWCSSNNLDLQHTQSISADLGILLIKSSENYKPLRSVLTKIIDDHFITGIQSNILHYSLNNNKETFRLPSVLVTRPIGTHMITLARLLFEVLKFHPEFAKKISSNCWSTIFLWFFVFKSNAMLQNLILSSILYLFDCDEKRIKEVLIDKKFLPKLIETLLDNTDSEFKDFTYFCKKLSRRIFEYVESKKSKLTKDIQNIQGWKILFPPLIENVSKSRPMTRSNKKGHTFILGLDPLEKVTQRPPAKVEHDIEHLSSQLDLIYKIN